jgi:hypothetical protein
MRGGLVFGSVGRVRFSADMGVCLSQQTDLSIHVQKNLSKPSFWRVKKESRVSLFKEKESGANHVRKAANYPTVSRVISSVSSHRHTEVVW